MNNNISGFFIFPFSFFYHFTMLSCFWKMNALISDNGKTFIICLKPVWQQCKFFVDLRKMQIHALTKSWTLLPHSPWRFNIFIFVGYDNSSASFVGFSRMWLFAESMRARSHRHYRHWKFDICLVDCLTSRYLPRSCFGCWFLHLTPFATKQLLILAPRAICHTVSRQAPHHPLSI